MYHDKEILAEIDSYMTGYWLSDFANLSSILFHRMKDINWAGFYLYKNQKLVLGPFCGKPACTEIALGRGVCGTAFKTNKILNVPDVHSFSDHIVCDSASNSELVIPFFIDENLQGVLDLDSPIFHRFTTNEEKLVSQALDILKARCLPTKNF